MKYICTRSIAGLVSFHQCWWWSDLWQNLLAVGKVRQAPAISRAIPTISSLRTWVRCARFSYGDATCVGEITPRLGTEVNPGSILSLFFRTFLLKYFEIRLSKSFNYFHRHRSESCYGPNQGLPKIRRRADVTFWSSCLKKLSGALAWIWTWHGDIIWCRIIYRNV